jgi:hypothetical protein
MSHTTLFFGVTPFVTSISAHDNLEKIAKSQHCDVRSHVSSHPSPFCQLPVLKTQANMQRSTSADPAKLKSVVKILIRLPDLKVPEAMRRAKFSSEEVADTSLCRFIQRSLPGKTLKGLKAHVVGPAPSLPPPPDRTKPLQNRASPEVAIRVVATSSCPMNGNGASVREIAVTPSLPLPQPTTAAESIGSLLSAAAASSATNKQRKWDSAYYSKKKVRSALFLTSSPATQILPDKAAAATSGTYHNPAVASLVINHIALNTHSVAAVLLSNPWAVNSSKSTVRSMAARKMAKSCWVKPAVENILRSGDVAEQAAVLRAVEKKNSY